MSHLLVGCPFSRALWHEVLSWTRSTILPPDGEDDFVDWWQHVVLSAHRAMRKGTSLLIMSMAWWIWKQRNAVVFDHASPDLGRLLTTIQTDAQSWGTAGAKGLNALIPAVP
uniref:Uncharacterized protein n=1 Tax=Avena sativa TaxID=4498 RepID=A0ACD5W632_AVESA